VVFALWLINSSCQTSLNDIGFATPSASAANEPLYKVIAAIFEQWPQKPYQTIDEGQRRALLKRLVPEFAHTENCVMRELLPYLTPERDRWLLFQLLTESRFPVVKTRALFYCLGKICQYGMKEPVYSSFRRHFKYSRICFPKSSARSGFSWLSISISNCTECFA
jgi:hypothetical protein